MLMPLVYLQQGNVKQIRKMNKNIKGENLQIF